ncbi:LarC family nickel insertion protein [Caldicellulosiruptoraceae bacterium PP1]
MKVLYFDCISGAAGDMLVASLLDSGVDFEKIKEDINKLNLNVELKLEEKEVNGIKAKRFIVIENEHHHEHDHDNEHSHEHENGHHHHRTFKDIRQMIEESSLNDFIKNLSIKIFEKIASAEAKVHGKSIEDVAFHEVGAVDSIVDIVSFASCIDFIKPDQILFSNLYDGKGLTKSMHGIIPIPAPAVLEIAKQNNLPIGIRNIEMELITPTGIGIAAAVAEGFCDMPLMVIEKIGYGAGSRELKTPNVIRVVFGEKKTQ